MDDFFNIDTDLFDDDDNSVEGEVVKLKYPSFHPNITNCGWFANEEVKCPQNLKFSADYLYYKGTFLSLVW